MKKLLLLFSAVALLFTGCVNIQSQKGEELAGYYEGMDNYWMLDLRKTGDFNFAFWHNPDGSKVSTMSGYCKFDTDNPNEPEVILASHMMSGKFKLRFIPERKQLNVELQLPEEHPLVVENGRVVKLYKSAQKQTKESLMF